MARAFIKKGKSRVQNTISNQGFWDLGLADFPNISKMSIKQDRSLWEISSPLATGKVKGRTLKETTNGQ